MSKKGGRPRKAEIDRRTEVLTVRATKGEMDIAYRLARRRRCTLAQLLHLCLHRIAAEEASTRVFVRQKLTGPHKGRILAGVVLH